MGNLTQEQLAALIANVVSQVMQGQTAAPKAAPVSAPVDKLAQRHAAILKGFQRKGYKDAKLFVDIKPFKAWYAEGRIVKKGQKSIKGLFHRDQTEVIAKAQPKPAVPAEQAQLFAEAKRVFAKKKAKAQPVA
jgi:hypothetical protein